jgi:hypothetical protein
MSITVGVSSLITLLILGLGIMVIKELKGMIAGYNLLPKIMIILVAILASMLLEIASVIVEYIKREKITEEDI